MATLVEMSGDGNISNLLMKILVTFYSKNYFFAMNEIDSYMYHHVVCRELDWNHFYDIE